MIVTVLALVVVGLLTWGLGYIVYRAAAWWFDIYYKEWSGKRKYRRGIQYVRKPWNRGTRVTYAEFVAGKKPTHD